MSYTMNSELTVKKKYQEWNTGFMISVSKKGKCNPHHWVKNPNQVLGKQQRNITWFFTYTVYTYLIFTV